MQTEHFEIKALKRNPGTQVQLIKSVLPKSEVVLEGQSIHKLLFADPSLDEYFPSEHGKHFAWPGWVL